mmetsp:Transcript_57906/g.52154  ORF Transcript_57906/g.52154 Transcript_57906/m.52154 type:complete len:193 (+) Transcript_57906:137-715(+)
MNMNRSFISALAFILALSYQQSAAVDDDDCEFDFYSNGDLTDVTTRHSMTLYFDSGMDLNKVIAEADIRIYTKDGDIERTKEDIEFNDHSINNEDINGDYNIEKIEIYFAVVGWLRMKHVALDYITIECGSDIIPSGKIKIGSSMLQNYHMKILPEAFNCQDDQECLAKHIETWDKPNDKLNDKPNDKPNDL